MNGLRSYLFAMICLSVFVSILYALVPNGSSRRHIQRLCSIAFILMLLSPVLKLDEGQISSSVAALFLQQEQSRIGFQIENTSVLEKLVREETEACIAQKAEELAMEITVHVQTEFRDGVPFPVSAELHGLYSQDARKHLAVYMERELDIQEEKQIWIPVQKIQSEG